MEELLGPIAGVLLPFVANLFKRFGISSTNSVAITAALVTLGILAYQMLVPEAIQVNLAGFFTSATGTGYYIYNYLMREEK